MPATPTQKITVLCDATPEVPLATVLAAARRLLTTCDALQEVVVQRKGIRVLVTVTVSKVGTKQGSFFSIEETFQAERLPADNDLLLEESGG